MVKRFLTSLLGASRPGDEDVNVEDYMKDMTIREGKIIEDENVTYVKPMELDAEGTGIGNVLSELERRNVVILNVKALLHNKTILRAIVKELRDASLDMDGDLARISEEKILLVPNGMRIVSRET